MTKRPNPNGTNGLQSHEQRVRILGRDLCSLVGIQDLYAICLAMLDAAGKLALGLPIRTQIALRGEDGEIAEFPFIWRILPRSNLVELDAELVGWKLVFHLACQFAGMAARAPTIIQQKSLSRHPTHHPSKDTLCTECTCNSFRRRCYRCSKRSSC